MRIALKNDQFELGSAHGVLRLPAEFEPHRGSWLLWPERPDNWRQAGRPGQQALLALARAILEFEPVTIGVSSNSLDAVSRLLPSAARIVKIDYDDVWIRDTGPLCVIDETDHVWGTDWRFNSWGGLFESWEKDDSVAAQALTVEGIPRIQVGTVLEGGAIGVDGVGTLVTTEECLLHKNRNPSLSRGALEEMFAKYFGARKTIWIPRGLSNDETGGHVDNMCAFVRPGTVVLAWTDDTSDPQYERSMEALHVLEASTDSRGKIIQIIKLPLPSVQLMSPEESTGFASSAGTISRRAGDRLAASYVNFYAVNGGVIVPAFGDRNDHTAVQILKELFPDRKIVSVNSREFLLGGGAVHCLTQQIPLGKIN